MQLKNNHLYSYCIIAFKLSAIKIHYIDNVNITSTYSYIETLRITIPFENPYSLYSMYMLIQRANPIRIYLAIGLSK